MTEDGTHHAPTPARRHATALFADIAASTALAERVGVERAHELIAACLAELRRIVRRHGGLAQGRGDGVLAIFGVPLAQEDSARAALNAAIEMRERYPAEAPAETTDLLLSIGVSSGPMVYSATPETHEAEIDVVGDDANLASRLSDLAPGGHVYVSASTRDEVGSHFDFEELGPRQVKGRREPVTVFDLVSRSVQLHRSFSRSDTLRPSPLVGRDEALEILSEEFRRLLETPERRLVFLEGEAGIGKTRLVEELARHSDFAPGLILVARALSIGGSIPYHPFHYLLREWAGVEDASREGALDRLVSALEDTLGANAPAALPFLARLAGLELSKELQRRFDEVAPEGLEVVMRRSFALLLESLAKRVPLVLVFEDLHWSDDSSVGLLEHLERVLATIPILFVLVSRPGGDATQQRFKRLRNAVSAAPRRIRLEPLDKRAAGALADHLLLDLEIPASGRSAVLSAAGGNPLFLEELVRSIRDDGERRRLVERSREARVVDLRLPGTILDLMAARIDRLPPEVRSVLEETAVVGTEVSGSLLASVSEADPEALRLATDRLVESGLLTRVRRGADDFYSFRHPLAQEAAYAGILAVRRRDLHGRVARALEVSGVEDGGAPLLAHHYSRSNDTAKAEAILLEAGRQAAQAAASEEALRFFQQAADALLSSSTVQDPHRLLEIRRDIALANFYRGAYIDAAHEFDQVLELLGYRTPATRVGQAIRFLRHLVWFVAMSRFYEWRTPKRQASEKDRDVLNLMFLRARAQVTADTTRLLFDATEGVARSLPFDPKSLDIAASMHAGAMGPFSYGGLSFSIAKRCITRALALVDPANPQQLLFARVMNFVHHLLVGDWDPRHEIDDGLLEKGLRLGQVWEVATYLGTFALRLLHQGRFSETYGVIERLRKIDRRYANEYVRSNWRGMSAFAALKAGKFEEAVEAAGEYLTGHDEPAIQVQALGTRAHALAALGRTDDATVDIARADQLVRGAGRLAPFQEVVLERARLYTLLVRLDALGSGRGRNAKALGRAAKRTSRRVLRLASKVAWERPEALRLHADFLARSGHDRAALSSLADALLWCDRLAALPERARCLRDASRIAQRTGASLQGMSAAQLEREAASLGGRLGLRDVPGANAES